MNDQKLYICIKPYSLHYYKIFPGTIIQWTRNSASVPNSSRYEVISKYDINKTPLIKNKDIETHFKSFKPTKKFKLLYL